MKIAVFHNLPAGGAKRVLYYQLQGLSKKHELHLFEFNSTDEDFLDIRPFCKKVKTYKFDIKSELPIFLGRAQKDYLNFLKLRLVHKRIAGDINEENFDCVLIHPDRFTQAPFLLRYVRTPSLYYCEELLRIAYEKELDFREQVTFLKSWYEKITRKLRKKIDRENARSATKILVNSSHIKKNVRQAYGKDSEVCYPGVDINIFKTMGVEKKKVLFVGNWAVVNGYELVKNAVILTRREVNFNFKQVIFSKKRTDSELAKDYSESLVTICASYNEPFGLVSLESMACKTPVLAVNEGGYRETVVNGVTGYLIPRDPKAFAQKIEYLVENPGIAKKMGEAGRELVKKNFTWEKHSACLERHLKEVAKTK